MGRGLTVRLTGEEISIALHQSLAIILSPATAKHCIVIGHNWFAFYDDEVARLVNALTVKEIPFHSFLGKNVVVLKVVFTPNLMPSGFTVAAITNHG
ncbi:hypothetical protein OsI_03976 [Oryza sativa Indica Group]|uniref:Uncharacterized protein n=1 Tax=Oryza sativa subsp. indica TaxID=39946 RepID=B8AAF0_ORYSI|nr:hypothetical protein OsI_03976 [Oryza sativa Indica Group]